MSVVFQPVHQGAVPELPVLVQRLRVLRERLPRQPPARANTVQLGPSCVAGRRPCRMGPARVVSALDVPLDVLAFDDAGRRAVAAWGVEPA